MHIRRFQLSGFRNYRSLDLEPPPGALLFLGDNAQGKSNLLEAVALLATGKSVRAGQDAEMIGWGQEAGLQPFARVHASVERRQGAVEIETIVAGQSPLGAPQGRGGKRFRVNGIARRAVDFVGQLRAVLFTADDLDIVSGPPANRRRLPRHGADPGRPRLLHGAAALRPHPAATQRDTETNQGGCRRHR